MIIPFEGKFEHIAMKILEINKDVFGDVLLCRFPGVTDVYIEFELIYDELPEECTIQIGNWQENFRLMHVETTTAPYGLYTIKFYLKKVGSKKSFSEWIKFLKEMEKKV